MFKRIVTGFNDFAARTGFYLYFLIFLAVFILFFAVTPVIGGGINSGLGAHVCGYSVLSFSALLLFRTKEINRIFLKAALFAGGYGLLIETIQLLVPFRLFEISDIIVNFSASVVGTVPGYFLVKNKWI